MSGRDWGRGSDAASFRAVPPFCILLFFVQPQDLGTNALPLAGCRGTRKHASTVSGFCLARAVLCLADRLALRHVSAKPQTGEGQHHGGFEPETHQN